MPIRAANAPVSWGIMEVEDWSPHLAPGIFLDELALAGYEATELGPYGYLPTDPEALGVELRLRSLALVSAFVPLRLKEPGLDLQPAREVCTLLAAMGARHLVLADALWPEREAVAGRADSAGPSLTASQSRTVTENVGRVVEMAASFSLRGVFHHHAGTYIETPDEVARLMESTSAGLCLDTGHWVYGGGDPVEAVERYGTRVEHLHLKDVNPAALAEARRASLGFLDGVRAGVFCELGAGCVRFPELRARLEDIGYDGWAVVEQDVDTAGGFSLRAPFENARAGRKYLRRVFGI